MRLGQRAFPIETLSATSMMKAVACPEAWRRRYLLHEREGFGVDRFVGSVDHATIAGFMDDKKNTGMVWSPEQLFGAYSWCWDDELKKSEEGGEPPNFGTEDPGKLSDQGKLMVHTYVKEAARHVEPIAVESRFEEKVPGVPVPVIGYIDLETQEKIIERKTSKTKVSKPRPGWQFQGKVYQLAQRKPVEWHVSTRQVTPQVVTGITLPVVNPDPTVVMIQSIWAMLNDYYQRYGTTSPWPTTGLFHPWMCGTCGYGPSHQASCVAWKDQTWAA